MPENRSYRSYADLQRPFVVWNVFATPELSLDLKQWCYPVVGCAGYRGYFDREAAEQAAARQLRAEGYEVSVTGVPAYSTLGWFADPLLEHIYRRQSRASSPDSFFMSSPTRSCLSVATRRLTNRSPRPSSAKALSAGSQKMAMLLSRNAYADFAQRRREFLNLLLQYRGLLHENYLGRESDDVKRERKQQLFAELKDDYARLRASWGGFAGYDRFFAQD